MAKAPEPLLTDEQEVQWRRSSKRTEWIINICLAASIFMLVFTVFTKGVGV